MSLVNRRELDRQCKQKQKAAFPRNSEENFKALVYWELSAVLLSNGYSYIHIDIF